MIQCHEYIANQGVTTLTERGQSVEYIVRNERNISRISQRWLLSNQRCVLRPYIHIIYITKRRWISERCRQPQPISPRHIHTIIPHASSLTRCPLKQIATYRYVLAIHRYVHMATRAKRRLNTRSRLEMFFSFTLFRGYIRCCSSTERQRASDARSKPKSNFPVTMDLTHTIRRSMAPWTNEDGLHVVCWFPAGRCPSPGMFVECVYLTMNFTWQSKARVGMRGDWTWRP